MSLFSIIEAKAKQLSGKTALVFQNESVTFGELLQRVEFIAAGLRKQAVKRGQIVPILLPRGIDGVLAMLAVWKVGAAVCMLDVHYPADRIEGIRQDCGVDFLLNADFIQSLPSTPTENIPAVETKPNDLAYVVFTSGSTGKPKGVLIPQHALVSCVDATAELLDENHVFLSLLAFSFVATASTAIAPIACGLTVHIADDLTRKDVNLIVDYVKANQITSAMLSPSMAASFLQLADGHLRCLLTGSERVRNIFSEKQSVTAFTERVKRVRLISSFAIDKPYDNTPLGYETSGCKLYLLDDDGKPVKDGEKGEICVSGQIALGYLNLPELTAERFTPNPLATGENDTVLFHTRDIGRLLPNGALEYIERKDWMIKVHGFRVEPGEIETVMLKNAPIEKAVVVGFTDKSGDQKLYGCYTAAQPVAPSLVREQIALQLPDYMMPAFLEQVDTLPVNANGKIDRSKITPPDIAKYQAKYVAPTNDNERALCKAFENVLDLQQVGINDDFVKLGGDSLAAVSVQLLLPETMQMSAATITALRTPKEIAEKGIADTIPIAADRKEWTVTLDEQWFLQKQKNNPTTTTCNINMAMSLSGHLDIEKLEQSLWLLLQKHRVLRSVYHQDSAGNFIRQLTTVPDVVLQRVLCPQEKILDEIKSRNQPFDTSKPLYRFVLFEIDTEHYVLYCCVFHSVLDGPGAQIFFEELASLYSGKTTVSEQAAADFLDFAVWRDSNPKIVADKEFYRQMFADGLKINKMPMKVPFPEHPAKCDGMVRQTVDLAPLEQAAKKYGVSNFTLLVSALGLTLGKYCQSSDVVLCLVMNTRFANSALQNTLGMLADRFPIRLRWNKTQTLSEFIKTTDELLANVQYHQACSGRQWMKETAPEYDHDNTPIMNVNYNREILPPSFGDLQTQLFPVPPLGDTPKVLSMLGMMWQTKQSINANFLYPLQLFEANVPDGMMECFVRLLQTMGQETDDNLEITLAD